MRIIRQITAIAAIGLGFWLPFGVNAAVRTPELIPGAQIYERSDDEFAAAIVVDADTGKQLYAYKPDMKWPAASLTKLMSALVTVDRNPNWSKVVTLKSIDEVGGGRLRVSVGSAMTIQDMFYSSIVGSANNTTMALARLSGYSQKNFVKKMNQKAAELGMKNSSFADPSGMDPKNTLTARDAYTLAKTAFGTYPIQKAAATASYQFRLRNSTTVKKITNTNVLLTKDPDVWVYGGKTGFLYESRYNLIVKMRAYPVQPAKPTLYVIVFGSPKQDAVFTSAKSLANWAYKAYSWREK